MEEHGRSKIERTSTRVILSFWKIQLFAHSLLIFLCLRFLKLRFLFPNHRFLSKIGVPHQGQPLWICSLITFRTILPRPSHISHCMCSPTTHPGSFRCSLHKGFNNHSAPYSSNRLNARRSAMTNSLVRIGTVEGDLVKRALAALIRPSSHQQRRRSGFQPRPSRLSNMSKAEDLFRRVRVQPDRCSSERTCFLYSGDRNPKNRYFVYIYQSITDSIHYGLASSFIHHSTRRRFRFSVSSPLR
ncbi:unnamed protein product, partial [Vitis vinifera]